MINERHRHIWRRSVAGRAYFAVHKGRRFAGFGQGRETMTSAMAAFGIAVAGTSLICYALMTRAEKIRRNRRSAGDSATDGGSTSGSDGWANWSGGHHSVTDSSGNPSDFGGGDSGGGDGGGGDGGGGGD
jgi:hypothetical protein